MGRRTTSRILISSVFLVVVMIGVDVKAQTAIHPSTTGIGTSQQAQPSKGAQNHTSAENNPACQRIIAECKKLVVKGGGSASRDGKPISVPVNPSDVQACRAAEGQHK